jgi:hypothetical protein
VLNLTKRQLICFGLAAAVGVPAYLFAKDAIGGDAAIFLMIGLMLPFFLLAMFEKDGQPAEKVLRNIARARFWPAARPYKSENLYDYIVKEGESFAETNARVSVRREARVSRRPRKPDE